MLPALRVLLALRRLERRKLVDVGPGDERLLPGARDDDGANGRILLQVNDRVSQLVGGRSIEGVENGRPVDGEDGDGAVVLEEKVVKSHEAPRGEIILHAQHATSAMAAPIESEYQSRMSAERPATNDW